MPVTGRQPRVFTKMSKPELVFYTTKLPNKLLDDLLLTGYEVFEATAFSEVLHVCEHHISLRS